MKLIVLSRKGGESLTLDSVRWRDRSLLAGLLIVPFVLGGLCIQLYGTASYHEADITELAKLREELVHQASTVTRTRHLIGDELSALTIKVAELQARIMRLDALGEQVAHVAKLNNGEFDFSRRPALGGPVVNSPAVNSGTGNSANGDAGQAISAVVDRAPEIDQSSLEKMIDELVGYIDNREQQLAILDQQLNARETRIDTFVAGRPVKKGWLSSTFGHRTDPFNGRQAWHDGVDFAGKSGAEIIAVAGGVVTAANKRSGYGNMVELNHGNGYVTRYAHNDKHLVAVGDVVSKGQVIAKMGNSGRSTGPHVHFEVIKNGKPLNPERYIYRAP